MKGKKAEFETEGANDGPAYAKAALGKRLQAAGVDYLVLPLVGMGFFLSASFIHKWFGFLVLGAAGLAWILYCLVKDAILDGGSIGKYVAGLMVVDLGTDGPCTHRKSLIRSVPIFVPGLNLAECLMVMMNKKGRRLGDMMARTMVVSRVDYLVRKSAKE